MCKIWKRLPLILKDFLYNGIMLCLSLTSPTLTQMTRDIDAYYHYVDIVELRADLLRNVSTLEKGTKAVYAFADDCIEWVRSEKKRHTLTYIFTLRTQADGGECEARCEEQRRLVLQRIVNSCAFEYVDIESDETSFCQDMYQHIQNISKTKLIVSKHWFDDRQAFYADNEVRNNDAPIQCIQMPWLCNMRMLKTLYPHAIAKSAVRCTTSLQLCALFDALRELQCMRGQYVLSAMGNFGRPARILSARIGSLWTYASLRNARQAAEGHFDPQELCEVYSYKKITENTRVFAVIGNPVMHSKSPEFHNALFREKKLNAVYIHIPLDNVKILPVLIKNMSLHGLSVTIPHKRAIISHLDEADALVQRSGSCNTIVLCDTPSGKKMFGYNTDIIGFLRPLTTRLTRLRMQLRGMKCTVIGSGGTAQAVCHALLGKGVQVLIVNRTFEKAQELARFLSTCYGTEVLHASITDYDAIATHNTLIVQATSVGMNAPHETPFAHYQFKGEEIAYDIVYTPPRTKFLQDAEASGCVTISGEEMFVCQAEAQSRLFCKVANHGIIYRN